VRPDEFRWAVYVAEEKGHVVAFLQSVVRPAAKKAWLGLHTTSFHVRRRGIATALWDHARRQMPSDIEEIEALAIPGNYFNPGLDPRYTSGLCFLHKLGFERFNDCVNLRGELHNPFQTDAEEQRLAKEGVTIRRASTSDRAELERFFEKDFGGDWLYEASQALAVDPPALHLALRDDEIIAFSGHSSQNREWGFFGPMGTTPAARGLGLGRVLLWHCLNDMLHAGHRTTVIPWVGPISFYHQWAGCVVDRVFWRYRWRNA
jgi:mycothiol synthase